MTLSLAKAAVFVGPRRPLQIVEYPIPRPEPGCALVRVACCTICRSDLHTWQGKRTGATPSILGHEIVGVVAELGNGLTHDAAGQPLAAGDRVTWTLHNCCGLCRNCRELHLPMKCEQLRKYGHDACDQPPHFRGGFAEYCLVESGTAILKLSGDLTDVVAAPANCAVATIVAGWEAAALQAGDMVLIQGAGALGCYAAAYAAWAGARCIVVTDLDSRRLDFATRFGATHCINVRDLAAEEIVKQLQGVTGMRCFDSVLELAGDPSAFSFGLSALRVGGIYIEIGCSFPNALVEIDLSTILWNRLTIRGIHNYDFRHLSRAIHFLCEAQTRFPFHEVVGAAYPLSSINEAMQTANSGAALRVAITP